MQDVKAPDDIIDTMLTPDKRLKSYNISKGYANDVTPEMFVDNIQNIYGLEPINIT